MKNVHEFLKSIEVVDGIRFECGFRHSHPPERHGIFTNIIKRCEASENTKRSAEALPRTTKTALVRLYPTQHLTESLCL